MIEYPREIQLAIDRLVSAGHEAYLVGGALRDLLLGREVNDFDIATSATPSEMKEVFSGFSTIETGLKHGTLTVLIAHMPIEITTFRVDGEYKDSRHPNSVRFTGSLAEDLSRRDFTVNAMAYSEKTGMVDLYDGTKDLQNRIIRAVGQPKRRFSEDALRILRAFRFVSKLGFEIEKETYLALADCREGLRHISAERICAELRGILEGENAYGALGLMRESGVLGEVLPEAHLSEAFDKLDACFEAKLAFLLLGTSKEGLAVRIRALKLSGESTAAVCRLIVLADGEHISADAPSVRRFLAKDGIYLKPFVAMMRAKGVDVTEFSATAAECLARGDCLSVSELAVNGDDLLALGKKGKQIGEILSLLLDKVLDDPSLNTKQTLLSMI